jgi:radical SAM superfamily enzyme YgiQ (UPF0313 family)
VRQWVINGAFLCLPREGSNDMILIHPPLVKPCEPPAGIAKLAGALKSHQVKYTFVDANLECILNLLKEGHKKNASMEPSDRWTLRARRHVESNLASLTTWQGYGNMDRYKRAVNDVNRVLERSVLQDGVRLNLSNYLDEKRSPVRSADLLRASEHPEQNPFFSYFRYRLLHLLEKEAPAMAGFSLNYLSQALCTFAMIGFLKQAHPRICIVLGGGLITSWIRNPQWSNPFKGLVDDVVAGPGEEALLSLLGVQDMDKDNEIDSGMGKHYLPDDAILSGKGYLSPGTILSYSTASGCYWNQCSFCPEKAEGNPYNPVSGKDMMADISVLVEKTKPLLVHLLDNAVSPVHLKAIADRPFGAPWYGFARISAHLTDLDFCMALKRSGCVMVQLGLESGDQEVLDDMRKGFELETVSLVLHNLKMAGIAVFGYLLFGTPTETAEKAEKTLDFAVRHSKEIQFLNLAVFNLPTYGPDAQKLQTGDFYEGDLSLYRSFLHPKGWDRRLVKEFLDKVFRKHRAMAPIIRRTPPIFTSNHAPFFCNNDLK